MGLRGLLQDSYTFFYMYINYNAGDAIAEAVSRWLPTAAGRVRARVW
jgi:hypothetical protein